LKNRDEKMINETSTKEEVINALKENPMDFEYASLALRNEKIVAFNAFLRDHNTINFIGDELKRNNIFTDSTNIYSQIEFLGKEINDSSFLSESEKEKALKITTDMKLSVVKYLKVENKEDFVEEMNGLIKNVRKIEFQQTGIKKIIDNIANILANLFKPSSTDKTNKSFSFFEKPNPLKKEISNIENALPLEEQMGLAAMGF
jgi:hypothetical protein